MLILKQVQDEDYRFLYKLLEEKESVTNISHQQMPTWGEHVKFNKSKPYKYDFVIKDGRKKTGRIYVTRQNEIGIHIKKCFQSKRYGTAALRMILDKLNGNTLYANIAPSNKKSQNFFKKFGFKLIQYTYRL